VASAPVVKFKLPDSSFWTGVIALVAVSSAATYFVFGFMSEADELQEAAFELEKDQIELRHLVTQITQSTDKITVKVGENTMQIMENREAIIENREAIIENREAIDRLNDVVLDIQENIELLVCDRFPERPDCQL